MFGKLIGSAIRVVTLPVDAANAAFDIASGGDGSKRSRNYIPGPISLIESLRDKVAETAEDIDD